MTTAVCFRCGKIKLGAFVRCRHCGEVPETEDDLALSLAMTDHYFDRPTLEAMGRQIADGEPLSLGPETHEMLVETIRESGSLVQPQPSAGETREKPWWKFW